MAHKSSEVSMELDYQERKIPLRLLGLWTIGLYVSLALVCAGVYFLYGTPYLKPDAQLVNERPMNQPALQYNAVADMKAFRAEQEELQSNYGWINREQGIVRLPISRAMDLVVERGFPTRAGGTP